MKTSERMIGRWADALRSYGLTEKQLGGKHTECPLCGGKDRFRFDDKEGSGSYYCNGCGAGDGFKLAMAVTGMSFKELAADLDGKAGVLRESVKHERDHRSLLKRIHDRCRDERKRRHLEDDHSRVRCLGVRPRQDLANRRLDVGAV